MTKLEAVLAAEVEDRSKANQSTSKQNIDLEWLKDDIAAVDSTGKRISGQIQSLQVEIRAEKRIKSMDDTAVLEDSDKRLQDQRYGLTRWVRVERLGRLLPGFPRLAR